MVSAKKTKDERDDILGEDDESAGIGHNSKSVTGKEILSIIERIERIEEERRELGADIREIYSESKGRGYEPKIIRQLIKLRKMAAADRQEQEALLATYASAIGMDV